MRRVLACLGASSRAALLALLLALPSTAAAAADSDLDGLRDDFEARSPEILDPRRGDSDGDGVVDAVEDPDRDGLGNLGEQRAGTRPDDRDSDGDGTSDGREDSDGDGRSDASEQDRRRLPLGLRPPLEGASLDVPAERAGCQASTGTAELTICEFSSTQPTRTVVLMGDSHAMMYMPALRPIAATQGWRLLTLVKGGCAPFLGIHTTAQRAVDGGASCRVWRRNALSWLGSMRPDVVIVAFSDGYRLVDGAGRRIRERWLPAAWKAGVLRTLAVLPGGSRVLVVGDVPENRGDPVGCLARHRSDMSACVSPREPPSERVMERSIREAARQRGAAFASLYDKVCPHDPCPLVQGEVLVWRDGSHLTRTFVEQLTPALAAMLVKRVGLSRGGRAAASGHRAISGPE